MICPLLLTAILIVNGAYSFGLFSAFSSFDPRPIGMTALREKLVANKLLPDSPKVQVKDLPPLPIVVEIDEAVDQIPVQKPTSVCTILLRSGLYEQHEVTDEVKWEFCSRLCARRPECFFTALPCHCPCNCKPIEDTP